MMIKLLIHLDAGRKYLQNVDDDFNSHHGLILKKDLKKNGKIKTSTGEEFLITEPNSFDLLNKLSKGPQIITLKDAGYMLLRSGISNESSVLEAGTGCGAFTIQLSKIVKEIDGYEENKKHYEITKKNLKTFKIKNVNLINENAKKVKKEYTHYFLDLKEPTIIPTKNLKKGGILTIYVPTINQVQECMKYYEKFLLEEICEINKRKWKKSESLRPENMSLTHTGFLIFLRKTQ